MGKQIQRSFAIGSNWVYYKIYTGHKTADTILTEIIKPCSDKLLSKQIIDKWFFIRYADPNHHLRVRFFLKDPNDINILVSTLYRPLNDLMEQDLVWKIQLDTYQRELERYGLNTMEVSESLFYHDSEATVRFLDLIEGNEGENLRWLFGLRSINELLSGFKYSLDDKLELMNYLKTGFGKEFGMSRPLKKQLDDKYRKERNSISSFLNFSQNENPDYAPILSVLEYKQIALEPIIEEILSLKNDKYDQLKLNNLLGSYIHMLMNRLFKSKNRLNEMVCYDFLFRYYKTQSALSKK